MYVADEVARAQISQQRCQINVRRIQLFMDRTRFMIVLLHESRALADFRGLSRALIRAEVLRRSLAERL
jgi:hypothetical protein